MAKPNVPATTAALRTLASADLTYAAPRAKYDLAVDRLWHAAAGREDIFGGINPHGGEERAPVAADDAEGVLAALRGGVEALVAANPGAVVLPTARLRRPVVLPTGATVVVGLRRGRAWAYRVLEG